MNKHADEDQASKKFEDFGKQFDAKFPRVEENDGKTTLYLSDEAAPNLRHRDSTQALRSAANQSHRPAGHLDGCGRAQA